MTTPLPQTPGDAREDNAIAAGAAIGAIYGAAELTLISAIARLARLLATSGTIPSVAARQLRRTITTTFSAAADRARDVLGSVEAETTAGVRQAVAANVGSVTALQVSPADTATLGASIDQAVSTAADSAQAALTSTVPLPLPAGGRGAPPPSPPAFRPFRDVPDPYRFAVEGAIRDTRGGLPAQSLSLSRIQAAQKALDDLAAHGITGFTDSAGRNWDLATYVEMATRTAVSNLWDELQAGAMIRSGLDLAEVGTHSTEGSCPRCLPWLGKTLSLTGATPGYPSFDEARASGLRHPNCRCFVLPRGAGLAAEVTNPVAIEQAAQVYQASQHQRALERRVRAAARRHEAAITPLARRRARADLNAARVASEAHRRQSGLVMMRVSVHRRERPWGAR